jgi:hypothetical protein
MPRSGRLRVRERHGLHSSTREVIFKMPAQNSKRLKDGRVGMKVVGTSPDQHVSFKIIIKFDHLFFVGKILKEKFQ